MTCALPQIGALFTAIAFYIALGVLAALFFGPATEAVVTLNWNSYTGHGGGWGGGEGVHRPWWAYVVQFWVTLFPVCDMVSVFPLIAAGLGNNLLDTLPLSCCFGPTDGVRCVACGGGGCCVSLVFLTRVFPSFSFAATVLIDQMSCRVR